ncbi:TlpA disulfide reductase family protein [Dyadobacter sediminis]|uniref:AhpC/TSA family protein n=1 Tax=Dyadobacter sediminis TaxID=1493691 RepID=A0A5R9KJH7_9BACT|nr:TlpA disulfide reductase family protein [Dyadobacter sediminis]TLU96355.1 AhpC/TSA family protein [Dyadobacter sediminis]GGB81553.1 thiol:disulfide interchange protein [Dyadobacter sediminis]
MKYLHLKCLILLANLFIAAILPTLVLAQGYPFIIKAKINPQKKQSKVMLWYPDPANVSGVKDSAEVKNGEFEFRGNIKFPGKAILYTMPDYNDLELFIESGTILIQSSDSLANAVVTAGPLNKDFAKLQKMLAPVNKKRTEIYTDYSKALRALPENADKKVFEESWEQKKEWARSERKKIYQDFITRMPNSLVSIEAIQSSGGFTPDFKELTTLFESLTESVRNSPSGKEYQKVLSKLSQTSIGTLAPNFTQKDTTGKLVSLTDFRGKYVFLDFWASWCGPCRAEHPALVKTFNEFSNQNFTIIGVSLDQLKTRDAWLKAIVKDGLTWTQLSDLQGWSNEASTLYNVQFIPKNYLIGPDGVIIAIDLKPESLKEKLGQLLPK